MSAALDAANLSCGHSRPRGPAAPAQKQSRRGVMKWRLRASSPAVTGRSAPSMKAAVCLCSLASGEGDDRRYSIGIHSINRRGSMGECHKHLLLQAYFSCINSRIVNHVAASAAEENQGISTYIGPLRRGAHKAPGEISSTAARNWHLALCDKNHAVERRGRNQRNRLATWRADRPAANQNRKRRRANMKRVPYIMAILKASASSAQ